MFGLQVSKSSVFTALANRWRKFFRWLRFNRMYLGKPPWDTNISPPELLEFITRHPPGRVIDLGCGTGTNLVTLARNGWQVTGVEFVPRAANLARRKLRQAGLTGEVRTGDVASFETVQGSYDLVLDIGCYHGLEGASRAAYRVNLPRILNPGGSYLIYAHWRAPGQERWLGLTEDDLAALQETLSLQQRQDSQDRFGRQATWMLFLKI